MLTWTVESPGKWITVSVRGMLSVVEAGHLLTALMTCLAEQPDALLIELSGMRVREPHALSVFFVVARQAATWPGTPVVLCAPAPETAVLLNGGAGRLPVLAGPAEARAYLDAGHRGALMMSDELLPVRGASRHARDVVTDACLRWALPHLVGPGSVIAGEMVANVIDHAGTMMTLCVTLRRRYLHVSVRDGSPEPPVPLHAPFRPGSGLSLIDASATDWGWLPATGGKVVWAALVRA